MSPIELDPRTFRSVLGLYPTGVTAVTARSDSGEPLGMVVGTFSSVSLDPPLVSFMPSSSSASYARLREASSFCVNVLSGDQEAICRRFATKGAEDKFAGLDYSDSPLGNPIITGSVAWMDCTPWQVFPAGDHDIVVGLVQSMSAGVDALPLLFLGGGYGRFSPHSRVMPATPDVMEQIRLADAARDELERCAETLSMECAVIAPVEDSIVRIASAGSPTRGTRPELVGLRLPLEAPFGAPLVAWSDRGVQERWVRRGYPSADDREVTEYLEALARVRSMGWSVTQHESGFEKLDQAILTKSVGRSGRVEPATLHQLVEGLPAFDPGALETGDSLGARNVSVPVRDGSGDVVMYLTAFGFPAGTGGQEVREVVGTLSRSADTISSRIRGVAVDS